jgi:hypothetical protein
MFITLISTIAFYRTEMAFDKSAVVILYIISQCFLQLCFGLSIAPKFKCGLPVFSIKSFEHL